jgi:hypothetical protein
MIALAVACLVGGFVAGWLMADHRARRAHMQANANTINAWINFKRPDVPPIEPYRSVLPSGGEPDR